MNRLLALYLAAFALVGCQSMPFSPFISPCVTGRVLAADTGEPLAKGKDPKTDSFVGVVQRQPQDLIFVLEVVGQDTG